MIRGASLSLLLLSVCGINRDNPLSPNGYSYTAALMQFLDLPAEERLSGGRTCKEVLLVPDAFTNVKENFAKLEFPEGAVSENTWIGACGDRSIYAVDTAFMERYTHQEKGRACW